MSETEVRSGRAEEIKGVEGMSFQEKKLHLESLGHKIHEAYEDDNYMNCGSLAFVGDRVFAIEDDGHSPYEDICDAKEVDGIIHYILKYYNGGTCFSEMFEAAIEKMEKDQQD